MVTLFVSACHKVQCKIYSTLIGVSVQFSASPLIYYSIVFSKKLTGLHCVLPN